MPPTGRAAAVGGRAGGGGGACILGWWRDSFGLRPNCWCGFLGYLGGLVPVSASGVPGSSIWDPKLASLGSVQGPAPCLARCSARSAHLFPPQPPPSPSHPLKERVCACAWDRGIACKRYAGKSISIATSSRSDLSAPIPQT